MRWVIDGGNLPPDAATLDHLDDRWSPERGMHPGERRRVAACRECNERRSNERTRGVYAEHQRMKSLQGHAS